LFGLSLPDSITRTGKLGFQGLAAGYLI
jgi:hypothetical protein